MAIENLPVEPKKPRVALRIGIAVVVIAVAGGLYALLSSGDTNRTAAESAPSSPSAKASAAATPAAAAAAAAKVVIPAAAGGMSQMTGSSGENVTGALKKANASNSMFAGALYAAYSQAGSSGFFSTLTLVPLDASFPLQMDYQASGPKSAVASLLDGLLTDISVEPAPQSGAMSCGILKTSVSTVRSCIWIDASEYGDASYPADVTNAQAAAYSTALWEASEES